MGMCKYTMHLDLCVYMPAVHWIVVFCVREKQPEWHQQRQRILKRRQQQRDPIPHDFVHPIHQLNSRSCSHREREPLAFLESGFLFVWTLLWLAVGVFGSMGPLLARDLVPAADAKSGTGGVADLARLATRQGFGSTQVTAWADRALRWNIGAVDKEVICPGVLCPSFCGSEEFVWVTLLATGQPHAIDVLCPASRLVLHPDSYGEPLS